jgi:phosphoserine phosphatase RsbU/P
MTDLTLNATINGEAQSWKLDEPPVTIGRSSKSTIHLRDGTVSKEHAELVLRDGAWTLVDLGSRNGTRVNGNAVREPTTVHDGDIIAFGSVLVQVGAPREPDAGVTVFSNSPGLNSSVRIQAREILQGQKGAADPMKLVHLLAEAGQLLVLPRPLRETCEEILKFVERAVPASRLLILLRDKADAAPVQMAARIHGGNSNEPLALSRTIMKAVLDDCTSVITIDAPSDPRFQAQESIIAQGIRSAMAVPLFDNQTVLGLMYADTTDIRVLYTPDQLEMLTVLANMAAVKITNARLLVAEQARQRMAQELATATRIQMNLLPPVPQVDGYACVTRLETCTEVGGDLYDLYVRADGRLVLAVGDVSGKGMGAALLMSSTISSARVLYDACDDPADLATRLNAVVARGREPGRFVTLFVGFLDPGTGHMRYVSAGHNPAMVVGTDGVRQLDATGIPLAAIDQFTYAAADVTLAPGELLMLYTDGITEATRDNELYGEPRLAERIQALAANPDIDRVAQGVLDAVTEYSQGKRPEDDRTLLLIRRAG